MLTAYVFLKETKEENSMNWKLMLKYYVHRYIRLTPPLMIAVLIGANLSKYYGSGPLYPENGFENPNCQKNWWMNMLYVNNLFNFNQSVTFIKKIFYKITNIIKL